MYITPLDIAFYLLALVAVAIIVAIIVGCLINFVGNRTRYRRRK